MLTAVVILVIIWKWLKRCREEEEKLMKGSKHWEDLPAVKIMVDQSCQALTTQLMDSP